MLMKVLKNLFRIEFAFDQVSSIIVSNFLDDLHDIFVLQLVIFTDSLRVVLHASSPNLGELELLREGLMDSVTEVEDG